MIKLNKIKILILTVVAWRKTMMIDKRKIKTLLAVTALVTAGTAQAVVQALESLYRMRSTRRYLAIPFWLNLASIRKMLGRFMGSVSPQITFDL